MADPSREGFEIELGEAFTPNEWIPLGNGRCGTCQHWDRTWRAPKDKDAPLGPQPINQYVDGELRPLPGEWGDCQRIQRQGEGGYGAPEVEQGVEVTVPAFLSDGSGYYASLATRSDFGCVLWEPRSAR